MKIVSIIQARMGSERLPGKVLMQLADKPLIFHVIKAISASSLIDEVILATTVNRIDDELASFVKRMGINVFRGDEDDVLLRYYESAKAVNAHIVIRNTGDNPLVDPSVINEVVGTFLKGNYDYVSNTIEHSWPLGLDTEVLSFEALKKANDEGKRPEEREHVTIYLRTHPKLFRLFNVKSLPQEKCPDIRLTVDTLEDYQLVGAVFNCLYKPGHIIRINKVIEFLNSNPEIVTLNKDIVQKKVFTD